MGTKLNKINNVINLFIFISLLLLFYIFYKDFVINNESYKNYYDKYYIVLIVIISFWLIVRIFFSETIKIYLIIISLSIVLGIYLIELYFSNLTYTFHNSKQIENYDLRTKIEVLEDLKKEDVVPSISPKYFLEKNQEITSLAPISGISNKKTIMCNESGEWIIYKSDRYGFNNNDVIWDDNKFNNFILGDSFAYGACVKQEESISGQLTKKGFKSANLAYSGNGPLYMLGSLKEYSKKNQINFIIWAFYEGNDLIDLEQELSFKGFDLQNYLKPNFNQDLISKQSELDKLLKVFYLEKQKGELEKHSKRHKANIDISGIPGTANKFDFKKFIKLYYVRNTLNLSKFKSKPETKTTFFEILNEANIFSKSINSELIFVYLPRFSRNIKFSNNYEKDEILKGVKALGIETLDMHNLIFKKHKDPLSLFPFRRKNHYNSTGYRLIADEIANYIINN